MERSKRGGSRAVRVELDADDHGLVRHQGLGVLVTRAMGEIEYAESDGLRPAKPPIFSIDKIAGPWCSTGASG
jgi:hypothetical protein